MTIAECTMIAIMLKNQSTIRFSPHLMAPMIVNLKVFLMANAPFFSIRIVLFAISDIMIASFIP